MFNVYSQKMHLAAKCILSLMKTPPPGGAGSGEAASHTDAMTDVGLGTGCFLH